MATFGKFCLFIIFLAVLVPIDFYSIGYVAQSYWQWYAVKPFGANPLTKTQVISCVFLASALLSYCGMLRGFKIESIEGSVCTKEKSYFEKHYLIPIMVFVTIWGAWLIGWLNYIILHSSIMQRLLG